MRADTARLRALVALIAVAAAAFVAALTAASAAAGTFTRGFVDSNLEHGDAAQRNLALDQAQQAESNVVRIGVSWRDVNFTGKRPANPTDPADPAYDFSSVDRAVTAATARGMQVMLMTVYAPDWAEGSGAPARATPGTWKVDGSAFGDFGEALATRYSGSFSAPTGTLPQVRYFEAWSEPNLTDLLAPQWQGNRAVGVQRYRNMLNAFYAGIHGVDPQAKIVAPGTAPYGDDPPNAQRTRPVLFLRKLLCLRNSGSSLRATRCPHPAHFDILSHHPINVTGGPNASASNPDDAPTADFKRLIRVARVANRKGTLLPRLSHRPVWATEFWYYSDPPNRRFGVPMRILEQWVPKALYTLWKQGVNVVMWWQLSDKPDSDTGLFFSDGHAKPILEGWRFPFVIDRGSSRAWAIPPASGQLQIQRRSGGGWRTVKRVRATAGRPLQVRIAKPGSASYRAVVGGETSLVAAPLG